MSYNRKEIKVEKTNYKKKNPFKDDVIYDSAGQWKYPGEITKIPSGNITMQGVPYPVFGIDNLGNQQLMLPNMDYSFPGSSVTEYPILKTRGWLDAYKSGGEMIKRKDGSYSRRGLWDNIRENAGSGKAPTEEMLEQERKIKNKYDEGGELIEDENEILFKNGGYVVKRSNKRKGKTHVVIGPDGTKKYFGDSKLGQHPKDPERKKAFYARHAKNLKNNPYFRAFARKTWEEGGEIFDLYDDEIYSFLDNYQIKGEVKPINPNTLPPHLRPVPNFNTPKIPKNFKEAEQMLESGELRNTSNPLTYQDAKLALDGLGSVYYPAGVASGLLDLLEGDVLGFAAGVVPFGKGVKTLWNKGKFLSEGLPQGSKLARNANMLTFTGLGSLGASHSHDAIKDLYLPLEEKYKKQTGGSIDPDLAKKILREGIVYQKELTDAQREYFASIAGTDLYGEDLEEEEEENEEYYDEYKKGGWLKKYQTEGQVTYGTPEYKKAYEQGNLVRVNPDGSYTAPVMKPFEVVAEDPRVKNAISKARENFLLNSLEYLSQPQKQATGLITGKDQLPSEAWGFQEPGGWLDNYSSFGKNLSNFAIDAVLDPVNYIGLGLVDDITRGAVRQGLKKSTKPNITSSVDDVSKSNLLSNKDRFSKALQGTSSLLNEVVGELMQGKVNKESIKKGNEWLENWIEHSSTKQKIDTDINNKIDFINDFLVDSDKNREINMLNLIRSQSKNFTPNSKEYDLLKQFDENLQQYLSNNLQSSIHEGNWGVSYMHNVNPTQRLIYEKKLEKPFDKYGSWISRTSNLPQDKRTSTTIHEGTHDWISKEAFEKSGMRNVALKNMNPKVKNDFLEWENYRKRGIDPDEEMGKNRAYQAYLADPTEQHARIMELRYQLGVTPDYKMDLDDAEKVLKWVDEGSSNIDPKFLNVIDKDPNKLAELFNRFWGATPLIGTAGALGAGTLQEKKQGGWLNTYK
jgi:hypothetical protein